VHLSSKVSETVIKSCPSESNWNGLADSVKHDWWDYSSQEEEWLGKHDKIIDVGDDDWMMSLTSVMPQMKSKLMR